MGPVKLQIGKGNPPICVSLMTSQRCKMSKWAGKMSKWAGKWANQRAYEQMSGQISKRAGKWANERANERTSGQMSKQAGKWANKQANEQTSGQMSKRAGKWANERANETPDTTPAPFFMISCAFLRHHFHFGLATSRHDQNKLHRIACMSFLTKKKWVGAIFLNFRRFFKAIRIKMN